MVDPVAVGGGIRAVPAALVPGTRTRWRTGEQDLAGWVPVGYGEISTTEGDAHLGRLARFNSWVLHHAPTGSPAAPVAPRHESATRSKLLMTSAK